jgi:hypothetical protein
MFESSKRTNELIELSGVDCIKMFIILNYRGFELAHIVTDGDTSITRDFMHIFGPRPSHAVQKIYLWGRLPKFDRLCEVSKQLFIKLLDNSPILIPFVLV